MVVFRPFRGEILVGKIRSCSPDGVHGIFFATWSLLAQGSFSIPVIASVGFFNDILIPPALLPQGSVLYVFACDPWFS